MFGFGKKKDPVIRQYVGRHAAKDFKRDAQRLAREGYVVAAQSENRMSSGILAVHNQHITVTYRLASAMQPQAPYQPQQMYPPPPPPQAPWGQGPRR